MNRRGRMSVSYSSVHDEGSIHIRSGSNLPPHEVLATFIFGFTDPGDDPKLGRTWACLDEPTTANGGRRHGT